ncbi:MAG: carboxylesterase family protein [Gemmatimonadetes bacterium]|nr:carboxylesterase family protein [Gemmatimonadota bacterium]
MHPSPVARAAVAAALLLPIAAHAAQQQPAAPPAPSAAPAPGAPVAVTIAGGPLAGRERYGVRVFRGIPYAQPPVGDLRWRAPQPVAAWTTPRDASEFGPVCPQTDAVARAYGATLEPTSEDCLTLNVWTAATSPRERRPVMVWIHGGSLTHGSGRVLIYDGTRFARGGVVLVTINYRLGALGFLAHPALSAESPQGISGNYAFLDQVAALRWVRENIAAFGGDPDNVTIFGESAGAYSVGYHLASPLSRGLFHKAILQSGSPFREVVPLRSASDSARSAERVGTEFAKRVGAPPGAEGVRALRSMPADSIITLTATAQMGTFPETVDGWFLTEPPAVAVARGRLAPVPIMIGSNADEATILVRQVPVTTPEQFEALMRRTYPARADQLLALYPTAGPDGARRAYRQAWTDDVFGVTARETARSFTRAGQRVYRYYYTRVADGMTGLALGAFHASEIPFVFGVTRMSSPVWGRTAFDSTLGVAMNGYWTRFAATGDPNGVGAVPWPAFTVADDGYLEFGATIAAGRGLRAAQFDLLSSILGDRVALWERASPPVRAGGSH